MKVAFEDFKTYLSFYLSKRLKGLFISILDLFNIYLISIYTVFFCCNIEKTFRKASA